MDEGRRQAYLAALGIELYVAREPLPHAAPSWFPEWEHEANGEADVEPSPQHNPPTSPAMTASGNSAAKPGAELTVPVLRNLKASPETGIERPRHLPADTSLRVGIAVFEWPGKMRVLIELSDADAPSLSAKEHRLWNEIALALWGREQAFTCETLPLFRFPPNARLRHLETPGAVREAVESFLQARQSRNPANVQLIWAGPGLAAAYAGERGAVVMQPRNVAMPGIAPTLLLPSLSQLLADWTLKPVAWKAVSACLQQASTDA